MGAWWCGNHSGRWIVGVESSIEVWSAWRKDEGLSSRYRIPQGKRTTYIDPSVSWCLRISGTSSQVYSILNTRPGGSGIKPSGPAWYRLLVFLVERRYLESSIFEPFEYRVVCFLLEQNWSVPLTPAWRSELWGSENGARILRCGLATSDFEELILD